MNTNLFKITRDNSSLEANCASQHSNNSNNYHEEVKSDEEDNELIRQELQIKRDNRNTSEKFRDQGMPTISSLDTQDNESDTTDNTSRKMSHDLAQSLEEAPLQLPAPAPTESERNTLQVMSGSIMSLLQQIMNPIRLPTPPRLEHVEPEVPRRNPLLSLFTSLPMFHHNSNNLRSVSNNTALPSSESTEETNSPLPHQVNQTQDEPDSDIMDQGAIIVRTVHPGPNGVMIVRMRVIPLSEIFAGNTSSVSDDVDSMPAGLFRVLFRLLATVSDLHVARGLDKKTLDCLPVVTYDSESFKNVEEGSRKCAICFDHYEDGQEVRYLWCLHRFHKGCVDQWLDNHSNCPICKKDFSECEKVDYE